MGRQLEPILAKRCDICVQWGGSITPDRPVSSSLWDSGLQLGLACLPAYRMTSLGLTLLLARHRFGKAVLDELHKRFGRVLFDEAVDHSVEYQKLRITLG